MNTKGFSGLNQLEISVFLRTYFSKTFKKLMMKTIRDCQQIIKKLKTLTHLPNLTKIVQSTMKKQVRVMMITESMSKCRDKCHPRHNFATPATSQLWDSFFTPDFFLPASLVHSATFYMGLWSQYWHTESKTMNYRRYKSGCSSPLCPFSTSHQVL